MATVTLNSRVRVYGPEGDDVVRVIAGLFLHFPTCGMQRRDVLLIDHTARNFERDIVRPVTVLMDQDDLFIRCHGDDVHPLAAVQNKEVMRCQALILLCGGSDMAAEGGLDQPPVLDGWTAVHYDR